MHEIFILVNHQGPRQEVEHKSNLIWSDLIPLPLFYFVGRQCYQFYDRRRLSRLMHKNYTCRLNSTFLRRSVLNHQLLFPPSHQSDAHQNYHISQCGQARINFRRSLNFRTLPERKNRLTHQKSNLLSNRTGWSLQMWKLGLQNIVYQQRCPAPVMKVLRRHPHQNHKPLEGHQPSPHPNQHLC